MARRRIRVEKIKEVIRYGVTTELSERAIGRALKVSRSAVTKYLQWFHRSELTWEQAQELPDSELLTVLEGNRAPRPNARYERLAERFPMMVKELRRKGVTLQLLWEEYLREHPDGYQSSQFCHHSTSGVRAPRWACTSTTRPGRSCSSTTPATSWPSWTRRAARRSRWKRSWRSSGPAN